MTLTVNGIELKQRDRRMMELLYDTDEEWIATGRMKTELAGIDYNKQVARMRDRLTDAGLIEVCEVDSDAPYPEKMYRATEWANQNESRVRVDRSDRRVTERLSLLEKRVDTLNEIVRDLREDTRERSDSVDELEDRVTQIEQVLDDPVRNLDPDEFNF